MEFNGKELDLNSARIAGIDPTDYPDYCDAYIEEICYTDGTPLTQEEMEQLDEEHYDLAQELIHLG